MTTEPTKQQLDGNTLVPLDVLRSGTVRAGRWYVNEPGRGRTLLSTHYFYADGTERGYIFDGFDYGVLLPAPREWSKEFLQTLEMSDYAD